MDWNTLTAASTTAGSLANWVNKSTITSGAGGVADNIIQEATSMIYGKLRHWSMLTPPTAGTMTIGSDVIAVPSDMLEPATFMITGVYKQFLTMRTETDILALWQYDGSGNRVPQRPIVYYFNKSYIQLDSPPDQAYPYALTYFQQPAALSASNPTNFLTSRYPRLLRAACMVGVSEWTKEAGSGTFDRTYWMGITEDLIEEAQIDSDRSKRATQAAAVFVGGGLPDSGAYF
jgi:hypothetical protein